MKIRFVSAATATDFEDPNDAYSSEVRRYAETPQLGVLALAAVMEQLGNTPTIVNLNRCYYDYLSSGGSGIDSFALSAAEIIVGTSADIYGFSSICSSYPLTVRIAQHVKKLQPGCVVVFGGPQASVVDRQTLEAFPFVDYVIRGEAEETFPIFLEEIQSSRHFESVPGLTYRSPFGAFRTANASVVQDLDCLPLPAFHLTGELRGATSAPLELGRGCPFGCTFCSTNDFFRRKFRLKTPERVLADMRLIAVQYGIRNFDLVHDMFTVDRRLVVQFCDQMLSSGEQFLWYCSARTDSVDEELLNKMAESGCRGIFFGVETGSQRMQKVIGKNLDVGRAREMVGIADGLGIRTAVSLITGFPEEDWSDLRDSVDMYMYSLRHVHAVPQFNLLAPLAETPIHSLYRNHLTLEELCSDIAHQGRKHNDLDRELIKKYPDIFPNFYLLPVPNLDRGYLLELREFLLSVPSGSRWLMAALHRTTSGILDVFKAWREYRLRLKPHESGWELRTYYMREEMLAEFVQFLQRYLGDCAAPSVRCLIEYHRALAESKAVFITPQEMELTSEALQINIPVRSPGVYVFNLDWDLVSVIESLKRGEPLRVVDRSLRSFRTEQDMAGGLSILETTPLIALGLHACDGHNNVRDFIEQISNRFEEPNEACILAVECLLETLRSKQLIRIYRPATTLDDCESRLPCEAECITVDTSQPSIV